eukprot:296863_1
MEKTNTQQIQNVWRAIDKSLNQNTSSQNNISNAIKQLASSIDSHALHSDESISTLRMDITARLKQTSMEQMKRIRSMHTDINKQINAMNKSIRVGHKQQYKVSQDIEKHMVDQSTKLQSLYQVTDERISSKTEAPHTCPLPSMYGQNGNNISSVINTNNQKDHAINTQTKTTDKSFKTALRLKTANHPKTEAPHPCTLPSIHRHNDNITSSVINMNNKKNMVCVSVDVSGAALTTKNEDKDPRTTKSMSTPPIMERANIMLTSTAVIPSNKATIDDVNTEHGKRKDITETESITKQQLHNTSMIMMNVFSYSRINQCQNNKHNNAFIFKDNKFVSTIAAK